MAKINRVENRQRREKDRERKRLKRKRLKILQHSLSSQPPDDLMTESAVPRGTVDGAVSAPPDKKQTVRYSVSGTEKEHKGTRSKKAKRAGKSTKESKKMKKQIYPLRVQERLNYMDLEAPDEEEFILIKKPKVVYSSAPVINKPEKKKKRKKDNIKKRGGGNKKGTGDQGKAGPPGDMAPSGSFVPPPEVMLHDQTHAGKNTKESKKMEKRIYPLRVQERLNYMDLEAPDDEEFILIEKPKVVYSSAPVINKPEKKKKRKKRKKDNIKKRGGGNKTRTGYPGKAGPPGDMAPSGSFVPPPEVMLHDQTHAGKNTKESKKMEKRIYPLRVQERLNYMDLEAPDDEEFILIEKPKVVYSSAPVINKPEKKKKRKKDNIKKRGGGNKTRTGYPGKAGPPGDMAPSASFVPPPEVMLHDQTHEPEPVVETVTTKKKTPKKIIRTAAGKTWEDHSLGKDMIPSTQSKEENTNISLRLEVDEVVESIDDDSSNDSYHDPASEEEDDINQEPEFMDCTPQNGDSTYQKGDNLFPLSTSEWVDPGGDHLSQETPVVKQEPTDIGEYENSVTQSVVTTQTKTVLYDHTQLSSSDAPSHLVMSDSSVGVVKQEPTDNGEYGRSVTQSVETTQLKTVYHCTQLTSSGATSHPIMSDINVGVLKQEPTDKIEYENFVTKSVETTQTKTSDAVPHPVMSDFNVRIVKQEPTDKIEYENFVTKSVETLERIVSHHHTPLVLSGAPSSFSVMSSSNIVTSSGVPVLPQSVFSNIPGVNMAQTPAVQNPAVIGAQTLLPVTPGLAQTINLATSGNVVSPQDLNVVVDPITTAVKQETPPTRTPTGSHNRGADDRQTDEGCKQLDEKMFNQSKKLQSHMGTQTGANKCDVCGKKFSQRGNLQRHMRIHTGDMYECGVCGKALSQVGHLQSHMRSHSGDKPYRCDVCGKEFSQRGNLQRHMRIHTGEKPYECGVCGKAFTDAGHLQRHMHMSTHTSDKPKCDVCGKTFSHAGHIQRHKRIIHTRGKPYRLVPFLS